MAMTAEEIREAGKALYKAGNNEDEKDLGIAALFKASQMGDFEARYLTSIIILKGECDFKVANPETFAIDNIRYLANNGYLEAKTFLNQFCADRYKKFIDEKQLKHKDGPLTDFDGKRIKIKRKGIFTPIDATLSYEDGKNILTFSFSLVFIDENVSNQEKFEEAVISGIEEWAGEYEVFNGQKVHVKLDIGVNDKMFDSIGIWPMTNDNKKLMLNLASKLGKNTERTAKIRINRRRSYMIPGLRKWSVRSRKSIYIFSNDDSFTDYAEIKEVAKHEFGHALGLGDLYWSPEDAFRGVKKGTYKELDPYNMYDKKYYLVMDDHHGIISNNDIEMVILAFSKNKMQLYQKVNHKQVVSEALGRGN